jgi:hypothetical protein
VKTYIARYETIKQRVEMFSKTMRFDAYQNQTGRKLALSISEVIALAVFKQVSGIPTKKAVYEMFKPACSYKTLVVNLNRWSILALYCLALLINRNRQRQYLVKHIDATDIPVCLFKNANAHKTMRGIASFGHTTQGTFFGLKLHLVSDLNRNVLALQFTTANVDDRDVVEPLTKGLMGIFVADAGYVSKKLEQRFRKNNGRMIYIQPRKNMKKLVTKLQHLLMKTRSLIELNFRNLKMFYGLISSLPRSVDGYMANYTYSLLAYLIA